MKTEIIIITRPDVEKLLDPREGVKASQRTIPRFKGREQSFYQIIERMVLKFDGSLVRGPAKTPGGSLSHRTLGIVCVLVGYVIKTRRKFNE